MTSPSSDHTNYSIGHARFLHSTKKFRFSVRQILLSLILLFVARPFFEGTESGQVAETLLFTFVMISSLLAVGAGRWELAISLLLLGPAIVFRWLTHMVPLLRSTDPVPLICSTLALAFTTWQMGRFIVRSVKVSLDVLSAGVSVYLLLGQLWAYLYLLADRVDDGAFLYTVGGPHPTHLTTDDAIYFSMSALTTAGFGDIVPRSPVARSLSTLESAVGVLYLAVSLGRLVAMNLQSGGGLTGSGGGGNSPTAGQPEPK